MSISNRTGTEAEDGWPRGAGDMMGLWLLVALIASACLRATVSLRTFATIPNPVCPTVIAADAKPHPCTINEPPHFADKAVWKGVSPNITKSQ